MSHVDKWEKYRKDGERYRREFAKKREENTTIGTNGRKGIDNISINNLKKALTKNLRELLKFLPYSNSNKDVSIVDLEIRFKKLSKYADKIRGKNKQTFKNFLKRFRYK